MKISDRLAMLTPAQLRAGRAFLAELAWRNVDAEVIEDSDVIPDADVVLNLGRHYAGGWPQFIADYCDDFVPGK